MAKTANTNPPVNAPRKQMRRIVTAVDPSRA
jgi:hypothetical protein